MDLHGTQGHHNWTSDPTIRIDRGWSGHGGFIAWVHGDTGGLLLLTACRLLNRYCYYRGVIAVVHPQDRTPKVVYGNVQAQPIYCPLKHLQLIRTHDVGW